MKATGKMGWLLVGLILSMAAAGIWISHTGSLAGFGGNGKVRDLSYWQLTRTGESIRYDKADDRYEILADEAKVQVQINRSNRSWEYLAVDVADMTADALPCTLLFLDEEKRQVSEQQIEIQKGHNFLRIEDAEFAYIRLTVTGCEGESLSGLSVQFRDEVEFFSKSRFLLHTGICFAGYALCSLLIGLMLGKCGWQLPVEQMISGLQKKYRVYGDLFGERIGVICSVKGRSVIRQILWVILIAYLVAANDLGDLLLQEYWGVHLVIVLLLILMIGLFCWEKSLRMIRWDQGFFVSGLCLSICMTASDLLVTKQRMWLGVFLILFWGFFYFLVGNMEKPEQVLREACRAVEAAFWIGLLVCLLMRPMEEGALYHGFFADSNDFALYAAMVAALGAARFINGRARICGMAELMVSGWMIWETQAVFAFGAVLVMAAFAIVLGVMRCCEDGILRGLGVTAVSFLCGAAVVWGLQYLFGRYAGVTGVSLIFPNEEPEMADAANLLELLRQNHWKYFLYTKLMIWKQALRGVNLWGHATDVIYNGKNVQTYNGALLMSYRYGILAGAAYIMMGVQYLARLWKKHKEDRKTGVISLALCIGIVYGLLNLIQNIEKPYVTVGWMLMMTAGAVLIGEGTRGRRRR